MSTRVKNQERRKGCSCRSASLPEKVHFYFKGIPPGNSMTFSTDVPLKGVVFRTMLLKEQFLEIYPWINSRKHAQAGLRQWLSAALKSGIISFRERAKKFFRKQHFILSSFQ
jgi:hypothetical protein